MNQVALHPNNNSEPAMSLFTIEQLLRMQRDRDFEEARCGFWNSTGTERRYWRGRVRAEIARERAHLADSYQRLRDAAPTIALKDAA